MTTKKIILPLLTLALAASAADHEAACESEKTDHAERQIQKPGTGRVGNQEGQEFETGADKGDTGPPRFGPPPTNTNFQAIADSLVEKLNVPFGCVAHPLAANGHSQNLAAVWLRTAFHDAGTYNRSDPRLPGGADGSVQHLADVGGNRGLDSFAPQFVEAAKKQGASDADIIQLAGVVSIKHCGGPNIPFVGGRRDNLNPNPIVVDRLPGRKEKYESIKAKFRSQGITPEEMVALVTGGHSMGGRNNKFFDETPGVFDNLVFKRALRGECIIDIDCEIAKDPELVDIVKLYARDQDAFFRGFTRAYSKMMRQTPIRLNPHAELLNIPEHPNVREEGKESNAKPHNEIDFDAEDQEIDEYQRATGKQVIKNPNGYLETRPYPGSPASPPAPSDKSYPATTPSPSPPASDYGYVKVTSSAQFKSISVAIGLGALGALLLLV